MVNSVSFWACKDVVAPYVALSLSGLEFLIGVSFAAGLGLAAVLRCFDYAHAGADQMAVSALL